MSSGFDDTDIFKCYRCMRECELHTYLIKYEERKCNLCHRPICRSCMKDNKNKRKCMICECHPEKRECWKCGWIPRGSSYQRLVDLHKHLKVFHYGKLDLFRTKEDYKHLNLLL